MKEAMNEKEDMKHFWLVKIPIHGYVCMRFNSYREAEAFCNVVRNDHDVAHMRDICSVYDVDFDGAEIAYEHETVLDASDAEVK